MEARTSFPILTTRDLENLETFYTAAFGAERTYAFTAAGRDERRRPGRLSGAPGYRVTLTR